MNEPGNSLKPDSRPLYDQAIDVLIRFIEQGDLQPGEKLPAEGAFARQLGISRPTLRQAMGHLESKGVITRRHGVGTFVTASAQGILRGGIEQLESLRSLADRAGVTSERGDWVITEVAADDGIAEKLEIQPGETVIRVQTTARNEECFFAHLDNYILPEYVDLKELENFEDGTLLDYLISKDEPRLSYTNTNIYAVEADEEIADWLRINPGKALIRLTETYYDDKGIPIVQALNHFITGCMNFRIVRRIIR